MSTGKIRIAAIHIDCPTPGCGGGVEGADGSFMLDSSNMPDIKAGSVYRCYECQVEFKIPASFKKLRP